MSEKTKPQSFAGRVAAVRATQLTDADLVWYGNLVLWAACQTGVAVRHVADEIVIELREIPLYARRLHDLPLPVTAQMLFADPRGPIRRRGVLSFGIDDPRPPLPCVVDRPSLHALEFVTVLKDAVDLEAVLKMPAYGGVFGIRLTDAATRFGYPGVPAEQAADGQGGEPPGSITSRFQSIPRLPDDAQLYEEWKQCGPPKPTKTLAEKYKVSTDTIERHTRPFREIDKPMGHNPSGSGNRAAKPTHFRRAK